MPPVEVRMCRALHSMHSQPLWPACRSLLKMPEAMFGSVPETMCMKCGQLLPRSTALHAAAFPQAPQSAGGFDCPVLPDCLQLACATQSLQAQTCCMCYQAHALL